MGGLLYVLALISVAAAVIGAVLYARPIASVALRAGRRVRLLPEPPPRPSGMPLERIVDDLRRLRPEVPHPPGRPVQRHRGVVAAYDGALVDACRALAIETDLDRLPDGLERETERLRVEVALGQAGVVLHGE